MFLCGRPASRRLCCRAASSRGASQRSASRLRLGGRLGAWTHGGNVVNLQNECGASLRRPVFASRRSLLRSQERRRRRRTRGARRGKSRWTSGDEAGQETLTVASDSSWLRLGCRYHRVRNDALLLDQRRARRGDLAVQFWQLALQMSGTYNWESNSIFFEAPRKALSIRIQT